MKLNIHVILYLLCASVVSEQYADATEAVMEQEKVNNIREAIKACQKIVNTAWVNYRKALPKAENRDYNVTFGTESIERLLEAAYNKNVGSDDIKLLIDTLSCFIDNPKYDKINKMIKNGTLVYHDINNDFLQTLTLEEILCAKLLCKLAHNKSVFYKDKIKKTLLFIEALSSNKIQQIRDTLNNLEKTLKSKDFTLNKTIKELKDLEIKNAKLQNTTKYINIIMNNERKYNAISDSNSKKDVFKFKIQRLLEGANDMYTDVLNIFFAYFNNEAIQEAFLLLFNHEKTYNGLIEHLINNGDHDEQEKLIILLKVIGNNNANVNRFMWELGKAKSAVYLAREQ